MDLSKAQIEFTKLEPTAFELRNPDADPIVTIYLDGRVEINPKYTTAEAAREFWKAVQEIAGRTDAQ